MAGKLSRFYIAVALLLACAALPGRAQENLLPDPSVEETRSPNQFGIPFGKWSGWNFEGAGAFKNGKVAHAGKTSAEIVGAPGCKLRLYSPGVTVPAGTYRFRCYVRGLDIGVHAYGLSEDVNFGGDTYYPLKKQGTFGWTPLEIVSKVPAGELVFRIGLFAPGRLWVDDASLTRVADNTPLTNGPVLGQEEKPIVAPGALAAAGAVHCPDCGYRCMPEWKTCYACGAQLLAAQGRGADTGPAAVPMVTFKEGSVAPFEGSDAGSIAATHSHTAAGRVGLQLNKGYAVWVGNQDWAGYDFIKAEVFNSSPVPTQLYVEVHDEGTRDYWTRVNYNTVVPPGASTLTVPTDLYVGEKSRPGRALDKAHIRKFVLSIDNAKGYLIFDALRLEKDRSDSILVPGLVAFSFGPGTSAPLSGFTGVSPSTIYSPGRGYGFTDAEGRRGYDVLQPDPLYQKGIFLNGSTFAVDVPDGTYHVMANIDYPSGFWGEYQIYHKRSITANGVPVVQDSLDLPAFKRKYFRFATVEDRLTDSTFDKYQSAYFQEKQFDVEVRGGKLTLRFDGDHPFACAVSAVVIYPASQVAIGQKYLAALKERRRFYFDNGFKRIAPDGTHDALGLIPAFTPDAEEKRRGHVVFVRDWMAEIPITAIPRREEIGKSISIAAAAGQMEPIVFSLRSFTTGGKVTAQISDLKAGDSMIPASAISDGVVSHRITRVTSEGSVYTISPRYILPGATIDRKEGVTETFWFTLHTPDVVKAGTYKGTISLKLPGGETQNIAITARIFSTPLDALNVGAGPWGSSVGMPWFAEELGGYGREMFRKCLKKIREYGCTSFSGIPTLRISEWKQGKPIIDYRQADEEMADAKAAGFGNVVVNYNGGIGGFNNYETDESAMRAAGFTDYVSFLRAVLTDVDAHAMAHKWLPVAFNLCDEPIGDAAKSSAANARAWAEAAPVGMITTGATSVEGTKEDDPHLALAEALRVPSLNGHDAAAIDAIHKHGGNWAFYNGGDRWTFGTYMYRMVRDYGMRFRLSWHWNAAAGDPYYALDCREDDYSWCATNAAGDLIPTIHFDREIRAGIDDYRSLLTLERLIGQNPGTEAAKSARALIDSHVLAIKPGDRDHTKLFPTSDWAAFRLKLLEAIEAIKAH